MISDPDFYRDRKYCQSCKEYVPYLSSPARSYCVCCGSQVRLFSEEDRRDFLRGLQRPQPFEREESALGS